MKNIILVLTLIFISSNSVFARLEFMDGGIVKVISGPSSLFYFDVYADENWKIIDKILVTDESGQQQFKVRIQPIVQYSKAVQKYTYCTAVFSMDNGTFDFGYRDFRPSDGPSEIFRVDMHNQQFIQNLRTLLNDCVSWTNWYDPEGSLTKGTFHGLTGDYAYVFRADLGGDDDLNRISKMRRVVLEIQLFSGENTGGHPEKTIHEPKALLSILDSLDEIQNSYQAAVDQKKQQQIASENESQDLANRQVSAEKAASERRFNEFKAQQEAQLRDNQKNDEIAAIKTTEEAKKQEIVEQVAKVKAKEIRDFIATPNGKALVEEIGKFQAKADKLSARDHERIDALTENVQKVAQTYMGTSELEERMRIARDELQLAWNTYHDSPELVELKQAINEKKMVFLKASGYTYDDAMQVLASAEKTQTEK